MASKEIVSVTKVVNSVVPAVKTSTTTGTVIDTAGYEAVTVMYGVGASGDTLNSTNKITLGMTESSDDSTYTSVAVTDCMLQTAAAAAAAMTAYPIIDADADASQVYRIAYLGGKRYIKPVFTFAGTHTSGSPLYALALCAKPRKAPL